MKALQTTYSVNATKKLFFALALGCLSISSGVAGTLWGTNITDNVSPTFTTSDSLLTVTGYSDTNLTTSANLRTGGDYFGVESGGSFKLDDSLSIDLAPGESLDGMGFRWTRSVIHIEGFLSDPGLTTVSPYISNESYANGALSFSMAWDGGNGATIAFSDLAASAGQNLKFWVNDTATGWQATITQIQYDPVPEPSPALLGLAGGFVLFIFARSRARAAV